MVLYCCVSNSLKKAGPEKSNASEMADTVNFNATILPILQKKCSPCHFKGGKMYEKMPFDKSVTILNHETGILKRIKEPPEAGLIKQFILQGSKGNL
jgi:hypothetical protein